MKSPTIPEPVNLKPEAISIAVSIGRGIFQKYFPPSVFKKFDSDYKLIRLVTELFEDQPQAVKILSQKGPALESAINKRNVLAVLQDETRIDFEGFIKGELGGDSPAYKVFLVFLERIENYENEEKTRILKDIDSERILSEDDYLFILELFAFERCNFQEFRKLLKFISNTQYEGHLIIASLKSMRNEGYRESLINLVKEKGTNEEKAVLPEFM